MSDSPEVPRDLKGSEIKSALGESQQIFRLLVDAVRDYAIFAMDIEGHILTWNLGARRLKGYLPEEVIGTHFSRFYTPEDIARNHPANELKHAIAHGVYEEEGWRVRKDGKRFWANVVITALVADGKVTGFAKVTRDLTERKKAEDALKEAKANLERRVEERTAELEQAKRMAEDAVRARDEFLSIASHELKTPLTSLKLQIQMRQRNLQKGNLDFLQPERFKKMAVDAERQVARIDRLVDDMLDISRLNTGKFRLDPAPTDLTAIAHDVYDRFVPQLEAAGSAHRFAAGGPIPGVWDRFRLEQIVTNLLTNAIKYGNGQPVTVAVEADDQFAKIRVQDRGQGIAEADHGRIFERFERAVSANDASGFGLGLYIARQIAEAHQGTLTVQSRRGEGATFTLTLPRAASGV